MHFTQDPAIQELFARLKQQSQEFLAFLKVSSLLPRKPSPLLLRRLEIYIEKKTVEEASLLGDFMTNIVDASVEDKLEVLATWDLQERLEKIIEILSKQMETINGNMKVTSISIMSLPDRAEKNKNGNSQRDITRRNLLSFGTGQLPTFPPGSGQDNEEEADELMELRKRLEDAKISAEAQKVADKELKRLTKMNPAQLEYQVCRNYLETLAEIPWSQMSEDRLGLETLSRARKQLDDDHYGLEKVKKRLLEYLAVLKLKHSINSELDMKIEKLSNKDASSSKDSTDDHEVKDSDTSEVKLQLLKSKRMVDKSPILLLVGPPGTGKTSLAKSVATALGRKFHRISLGGVRDEAEIRGHRKTYVAAMPGLIVNGLKKVGVANPVFLLDEIDKVGTSSFHGDPSAAMLEVLDPEQNCTFTDHYVNIPIDLSTVLFIATANSLDTIPPPLLDRMETISLSGYTTLEKRHIATRHLIPKQILTNGLGSNDVRFKDEVIDQIINSYTREAGVRNLEREIGSVCRAKAVEYSEAKDASAIEQYNAQVSLEDLERILGVEKFEEELAEKTARPGLVTGLVAYSTGGNGGILFIEIVDMPGRGRVQLTGKLGDVLKESVEVALSWVKAHSYDLGLTEDPTADIMVKRNIHVHCPAGAIPKDGPSAGLAHTIALISLFSGNAVPPTLAMTGEISLRGKVLAVGGIKEKLIGECSMTKGRFEIILTHCHRRSTCSCSHCNNTRSKRKRSEGSTL